MAVNSSVRRNVVQVSETPVSPAVHTIGVVGNEACVLTQQNIRKVVDIRMFTFSRLLPNGQLSPLDTAPIGAVNVFGGPVTNILDLFAQAPPKKVKVASNPSVRREVLKVSEAPVAPAVHIPIVVGNEKYLVIQQDVRKEVDIRMLTYSRLLPNGQLSPMTGQSTVSTNPVNVFGGPITNLHPLFSQAPPDPHVTIIPANWQTQVPEKPAQAIAGVLAPPGRSDKQLCYSAGTSTGDLMKNNGCQHCPSWEKIRSTCQTQTSPPNPDPHSQKNAGCQTQPTTTSTGCNTSSSLQLVGKKEEEEKDTNPPGKPTCSDPKPVLQQGHVRWSPKCPQEEPCTSRQIDIEDRRRYGSIRAKICAQKLAELRRQQQQDWENTPEPMPPKEWLQQGPIRRNLDYKELQQERREREQRQFKDMQ